MYQCVAHNPCRLIYTVQTVKEEEEGGEDDRSEEEE